MRGRVYINGRFLTQRVTGIQRYARETLLALDQALAEGADGDLLEWRLIAPKGVEFPVLSRIQCIAAGHLTGHAWEQLELPRIAADGLLLSFGSTGPLMKKDQIITVHDASVYRVPDAFSWTFRAWYKLVIRAVVARAPYTLAVSAFTGAETVRWFSGNPDRIGVTTEGWQHLTRYQSDERILDAHELVPGRYVLAVSSPTPNKNFGLVTQAAEALTDLDLTFAVAGSLDSKVFAHAQPDPSDRLRRLGYVSDAALKALYENALCFVFPSRYEGFGIPPLEAMSCGCPVLAARIEAVREVCGSAAHYFDPADHDELARLIRNLASDPEEVARLRERSRCRAKAFSWGAAANKSLRAVLSTVRAEM